MKQYCNKFNKDLKKKERNTLSPPPEVPCELGKFRGSTNLSSLIPTRRSGREQRMQENRKDSVKHDLLNPLFIRLSTF